MRLWGMIAALALGILCPEPARADFQKDMFDCRDQTKSNPDASIRSCRLAIGFAERHPELLNERNRADLWFQIALAYETKNDRVNAIAALDSAIGVYTEDVRFPYRRARQWQALGNCAKAIPDHVRSIQLLLNPRPGYATDKNMLFSSYMDRAACHEKLGLIGAAKNDYDSALAVFPGAEQALAARSRLGVAQIAGTAQAPRQTLPPLDDILAEAATRRAQGPALPKRVALIIGNTQYLHTNNLPNAVKDAEDVAQAMKAKGYAIYGYPRVNMHREDMFAALDEFARAAAQADVAFVWYAGHGQQMSDPGEPSRNWLFPVDFKGGSDLDRGAVPLTKLLSAAQPAKKLRVVVVDACRNTTLQTGARNARGFRPEPRSDMVIVYSTSAGNIAEDGDPAARNSPFAAAFLETFKAHGNVDVRQFFGGVSEGVRRRTQKSETAQQPELMSNLNTMETLALAP